MQDRNETNRMKLEWLKMRLAEVEAERDKIQQKVQALASSQPEDNSTVLWNSHVSGAVVGILAVASLLCTGLIHDAQSSMNKNGQPGLSVISAASTGQVERSEHLSSSGTRKARTRTASQQQWGPPLVMPDSEAKKRYYSFDPVVKEQQENLLTLGFDVGEPDGYKGLRTRLAIAEFRALYLPDSGDQIDDADLAITMETYANLARSDAARYGIDHGIVAAIRLSSVRTGVDFSYLMKLAATESDFEPESEAATSSATGLYQFTHDTWLNTLKTHGVKYGLVADYADNIEYYVTRSGYKRPILRNKAMYEHLLALRKNPRIAAMMAAESVRDNEQKLAYSFDREPTDTELYLTHFLGPDDAITFLQSLEQSPGVHAVDLFPEAARTNHDIFHPEASDPRTVDDVYALFESKLNKRRYE